MSAKPSRASGIFRRCRSRAAPAAGPHADRPRPAITSRWGALMGGSPSPTSAVRRRPVVGTAARFHLSFTPALRLVANNDGPRTDLRAANWPSDQLLYATPLVRCHAAGGAIRPLAVSPIRPLSHLSSAATIADGLLRWHRTPSPAVPGRGHHAAGTFVFRTP